MKKGYNGESTVRNKGTTLQSRCWQDNAKLSSYSIFFSLERNIKAVVTMLWRSPRIIIRGGNFPGSLTSGYCV